MKRQLTLDFEMSDMRLISYYQRLKVERDRFKRTIKLSQFAYIEKIVDKFDFEKVKSTMILMRDDSLLANDKQVSESEITQFQDMIDSIMFSMIEIRSDIVFAISVVSRYVKNSSKSHLKAVKICQNSDLTSRSKED